MRARYVPISPAPTMTIFMCGSWRRGRSPSADEVSAPRGLGEAAWESGKDRIAVAAHVGHQPLVTKVVMFMKMNGMVKVRGWERPGRADSGRRRATGPPNAARPGTGRPQPGGLLRRRV